MRVARDGRAKPEGTGDFFSRAEYAPDEIEMLAKDGRWYPIQRFFQQDIASTPLFGGRTMEELTEAELAILRDQAFIGPRLSKLSDAEETLFEDSLRLTETPAGEVVAARQALEEDFVARELLRKEAGRVDTGEKTPRQAAEDYTVAMKENDPYRKSSKNEGHLPGSEGRDPAGTAKDPSLPSDPTGRLLPIVEKLEKALGTVLRQGRMSLRGALGQHHRITGVIRQREFNAYEVFSHEAGHALHFDPKNTKTIFQMIARHELEIHPLSYTPKPELLAIEGFAEWFRIFLTSPGHAQKKAPGFHQEFTRWMAREHPETYKTLLEGKTEYLSYLEKPSRDIVTGDIVTSGKPPISDRIKKGFETDEGPYGASLFSWYDRFYTWTLDRLHPAFRAVKSLEDLHFRNFGEHIDLPGYQDTYKMLRLSVDAAQMGHLDITRGVAAYGFLTPEGPSLSEAMELAVGKDWFGRWRTDDTLDFGAYLVSRRALVEYKRFWADEVPGTPGKPTYGDYKVTVAELEARYPQFKQAAKLVYEWNSNMLRKKRDAGLITETFFLGAMEKAEYYVPFMRDFSEVVEGAVKGRGSKGTNRQSIMAAYRGSLRSIINPIESMVSDAYNTAQRIALNDSIKALHNLAVRAGKGGGIIAELIPATEIKGVRADLMEMIKGSANEHGLGKMETEDLIAEVASIFGQDEIMTTIFRSGEIRPGDEPIVFFWEGGERKALRLGDGRFGKELYLAITGLGKEQSNWVIDFLGGFSTLMRFGITTSPDFLVANYIRDQFAAFILMPKFIPFISGAKGVFHELKQTEYAEAYNRVGGLMGGIAVSGLRKGLINRDMRAFQDAGYKLTSLKDLKQIFRFTEVTETGTRLAIFGQYFKTGKKHGLTDYQAALEAAFQARDFIDFGRHGSKMLMTRRLTTFLNAGLQGMDKSGRVLFVNSLRPMAKLIRGGKLSAKETENLNTSLLAWIKLASLTAMSATYATLYADDPEFQSAGEYLRATHWLFKVPGGEWVAVPKPHELAFFFNAGERMAEGSMRDDPTWRGRWMRSWSYTLMPPTGIPGVQVPVEVLTNYSFFNERNIIPKEQLGLEPFLRYNSYTSEFAKAASKAVNEAGLEISPGVIDHVITGWGASWGRTLIKVTDSMMSEEKRSAELYDFPIIMRFMKNLDRGNDASNRFWDEVNATSGRMIKKTRSYKNLIETGREVDALDFLSRMRDDEKVWVQLQTEKVRFKRLHPMRRAADLMRIYSNLRTEVMSRNVKKLKTGSPISVTPTIASNINDLLTRISMMEARNALITIGAKGWDGRELMDPAQYLDAIEHLNPELRQEIDARSKKLKTYSFSGVRAVWPELEKRILRDGEKARLSDLVGKAKARRD